MLVVMTAAALIGPTNNAEAAPRESASSPGRLTPRTGRAR